MNKSVRPCSEPVKVAVATSNNVKVRAVQKVFRRFCNVEGVSIVKPPDIPVQPVGAVNVALGALSRAIVARKYGGFGVGIEAGPIEFYTTTGFIEVQIAAVIGPSRKASIGLSPAFELPGEVVSMVLRGIELADAVNVHRSGDIGERIGYVGYLTEGYITRQDLTVSALIMALIPWINGFHEELASVEELVKRLKDMGNQH